ncbi:MAG: AAA family ATPase [Bacteroidales bacterium]|nr:AAA family ATPase [Bacteroidales bacterium]
MEQGKLNQLSSYVEALRPIIYVKHFDFTEIDDAIKEIREGAKCLEFNNARGMLDFDDKHPLLECDLTKFLTQTMDEGFDKPMFLILKDIHHELRKPQIIALLRTIAERNMNDDAYNTTVFILSDILEIPQELENYVTVFDLPLPTLPEIVEIVHDFKKTMDIRIDDDVVDSISLSFKGLNKFQITQILNMAYLDGGQIDESDKYLILKEKEQFIKKSGMLEIVNISESINDIGGLDNLKDWLKRKAQIFKNLDRAIKYGVDAPKGILIVGMPGCGKSLTAKATAKLFDVPLVRLDIGRLLGKYVGESESNLRKTFALAEAISPCVLWIDEIEKAFSGITSSDSGNAVTTRLFGNFLTWMQEKDNTVFVVATSNDISKLPPEFLRKGRFDELFSVNLPSAIERKNIIEIHLQKRRHWKKDLDIVPVVNKTDGYCGADLETLVKETIEKSFLNNKEEITQEDLIKTIDEIKPISETLSDKIEYLEKTLGRFDLKPASKQ